MSNKLARLELLTQMEDAGKKETNIEKLDQLYAASLKLAEDDARWYQKRQRGWRIGSIVVRILTYITLAIGVVFPLIAKPGLANYGYPFLVVSGLLFSLDRTFLISQTWMRYISAEMEIRSLILDFRYWWYEKRCELLENKGETFYPQIRMFKTFICKVQDIITKETASWELELKESLAAMGNRLKARSAEIESKEQEIRARSTASNKRTGS